VGRIVNVAGTRGPVTGGGATGVEVRVSVALVLVWVAAECAVVLVVGDCVTTLVALVAVALVVVAAVEEWDAPPHPASSNAPSSPEHSNLGFTFSAYSADIRCDR
jgi:hypothetical protein